MANGTLIWWGEDWRIGYISVSSVARWSCMISIADRDGIIHGNECCFFLKKKTNGVSSRNHWGLINHVSDASCVSGQWFTGVKAYLGYLLMMGKQRLSIVSSNLDNWTIPHHFYEEISGIVCIHWGFLIWYMFLDGYKQNAFSINFVVVKYYKIMLLHQISKNKFRKIVR